MPKISYDGHSECKGGMNNEWHVSKSRRLWQGLESGIFRQRLCLDFRPWLYNAYNDLMEYISCRHPALSRDDGDGGSIAPVLYRIHENRNDVL